MYPPQGSGGTGGTGDMTKAVYDTDNNGVVDNSTLLNGQTAAQILATVIYQKANGDLVVKIAGNEIVLGNV